MQGERKEMPLAREQQHRRTRRILRAGQRQRERRPALARFEPRIARFAQRRLHHRYGQVDPLRDFLDACGIDVRRMQPALVRPLGPVDEFAPLAGARPAAAGRELGDAQRPDRAAPRDAHVALRGEPAASARAEDDDAGKAQDAQRRG